MKFILIFFAWLSLILGIIGIFVPVLPTTPFLLLSIYIFSKHSPKVYQRLIKIKLVNVAIEDWQKHRVIGKKAKFIASSTILVSVFFILKSPAFYLIKIFAILSICSVLYFILIQKTHRHYD
jgi:uncharacterized membrane protein YbaN (DUF454 family)